jgi:hypothetical protein
MQTVSQSRNHKLGFMLRVFTRVCHAAEVAVKQFPLEAPVKLRPAPEVGIEAKVAILKLQAVHAA